VYSTHTCVLHQKLYLVNVLSCTTRVVFYCAAVYMCNLRTSCVFNLFIISFFVHPTIVHFSGGFEFFSGLFQFPLFRRWPTKQQTGGLVVVGIDQVDLAASSLGVLVCPTCCVGRRLDGIECTVAFVHVHSIRQRGLGIFPTGRLLIRTRCIDQRGRSRGEADRGER
jgi:hypothetical protein